MKAESLSENVNLQPTFSHTVDQSSHRKGNLVVVVVVVVAFFFFFCNK